MNVVSILMNNLVLIHIFYNDKKMIVFDPADASIVEKARKAKIMGNYYTAEDFNKCEDNKKKREIVYIFYTHHHKDSTKGGNQIKASEKIKGKPDKKKFNSLTGIPGDPESGSTPTYIPKFTNLATDGKEYKFEDLTIVAIQTPCHTRDSYCYYVTGPRDKYLVAGDTLQFLGIGKFFRGDAKDMKHIIGKLSNKVGGDSIVLYGHDYKKENLESLKNYSKLNVPDLVEAKNFLTFSEEKQYNPFLNLAASTAKGSSDEQKIANLRHKKDADTGENEN